MKLNIEQIDGHLAFLRAESENLKKSYAHTTWASYKIERFEAIAEILRRVRQEQQMTTVGGKRLED